MANVAALRARYIANRDRVRAWTRNWDCPEVELPAVGTMPFPFPRANDGERRFLEEQAPYLDQYHWLLEGRPRAEGVSSVVAAWRFGKGHRFDLLEVSFRSYADPAYLSEKLALAAHAAGLAGWHGEEDVRALYAWLFEGLDSRPMIEAVRGQQRIGFTRFEILRMPRFDSTTDIDTRLRMHWTGTTLSGKPLNSDGEPAT